MNLFDPQNRENIIYGVEEEKTLFYLLGMVCVR